MDFASCVPIEKGWSGDRKYCVTDRSGARYLLRVMPGKDPGRCETTFRMMQQVAALGVPMCCPVEIGRCGEGVYTLQTWVDGQDAEAVIPGLAAAEQPVRVLPLRDEKLRRTVCIGHRSDMGFPGYVRAFFDGLVKFCRGQ